jgi:hypothetical protein
MELTGIKPHIQPQRTLSGEERKTLKPVIASGKTGDTRFYIGILAPLLLEQLDAQPKNLKFIPAS